MAKKERWLVSQDRYVYRVYIGAPPEKTRRGTWPNEGIWKCFTREELDFLLPPYVVYLEPGDGPVLLGEW